MTGSLTTMRICRTSQTMTRMTLTSWTATKILLNLREVRTRSERRKRRTKNTKKTRKKRRKRSIESKKSLRVLILSCQRNQCLLRPSGNLSLLSAQSASGNCPNLKTMRSSLKARRNQMMTVAIQTRSWASPRSGGRSQTTNFELIY